MKQVHLARGVYVSIRGSDARVARLRALAEQVDVIEVHVPIVDAGTHFGRVVYDGARRLGVLRGEPGDRGLVHCFFDEESLLGEIARAGLVVETRAGYTFTLVRGVGPAELPDPYAFELARVASRLARVERARRGSPASAVRSLRELGARCPARGPVGRARLRRAIGWLDALRGQNCLRRVLLEISLDPGAARETLVFGLDVGATGHVAFKDREDRTFDVAFEI